MATEKQQESFIFKYGTQALSVLMRIASTGTYTHNRIPQNNLDQLEVGGYIKNISDGDQKYRTTEKANVLKDHIYDALLGVGEPEVVTVQTTYKRNNIL